MDVRYINHFVLSIKDVFDTMCALEVSIEKPRLQTESSMEADVLAIIGFSGDASGSVALCFDYEMASKTATAFAGAEITPEHEDFGDALGELANMVAGSAKAKFDGLNVNISLPNVIIGEGQHMSVSKSAPRISIPCSTNSGKFEIEVGMEIRKVKGTTNPAAAIGANA